ncbi:MAG: ABC transporter permease, partial [Bacteroidia bacterium]|nr:ABC transporter permease [Bacteroidia bacterium]
NSNYDPYAGSVLVNGVDLHNTKFEGAIGYVPQDDLLIEDLTVFQNLYYNSKLCFGDLDEKELTERVNDQLISLGLFEARDLRVGSSLDKTISGGQRKRLNIALELIRQPMILFVDEPTSGLSSLDSENVMDLMKQLALNGKLVFVVIHQPSSAIYKLFDSLMILDIGGYPIFYGNPLDALIYFKRISNYVDADESECPACGNVNAEQIFSIIESKVMDEYGHPTGSRKLQPVEWYQHFLDSGLNKVGEDNSTNDKFENNFVKPSRWRQIGVFISRDILSKLKNTQYLLINFLEAPVLAFILAYFLKYSVSGEEYIFRENINLPAFIFVSVLVAIFMGLTVSAEEIVRDRKILKREAFLNLSHSSYIFSKMIVQFLISAIQTFTYVLVANLVFEIKDMFFVYWLILFSASCFANLVGLNISAAFKSVVTIYILIPFLIIPQIILSGVMVKFEDLNPAVTDQAKVPIIGELMTSRWAFEALAVENFKSNKYERHYFKVDKAMSNATYKKDFWLIKINDRIDALNREDRLMYSPEECRLIINELGAEQKENKEVICKLDIANSLIISKPVLSEIKEYTADLKKYYVDVYNRNSRIKDLIVKNMKADLGGSKAVALLKDQNTNESLEDLVTGKNNFNVILEHNDRLIQRFRPIYMDAPKNSFIRAPLYISTKTFLAKNYSTFWVNVFVIWAFAVVLVVTLYFNAIGRMIWIVNRIFSKLF